MDENVLMVSLCQDGWYHMVGGGGREDWERLLPCKQPMHPSAPASGSVEDQSVYGRIKCVHLRDILSHMFEG